MAVFNVLSHNRDDHSKNFSFIMNENGEWRSSPAYDLTFSSGPRGEQSMMVMGEGSNPGKSELIRLGKTVGINDRVVKKIIDQTYSSLSDWNKLAKNYGVSKPNISLISERLENTK